MFLIVRRFWFLDAGGSLGDGSTSWSRSVRSIQVLNDAMISQVTGVTEYRETETVTCDGSIIWLKKNRKTGDQLWQWVIHMDVWWPHTWSEGNTKNTISLLQVFKVFSQLFKSFWMIFKIQFNFLRACKFLFFSLYTFSKTPNIFNTHLISSGFCGRCCKLPNLSTSPLSRDLEVVLLHGLEVEHGCKTSFCKWYMREVSCVTSGQSIWKANA